MDTENIIDEGIPSHQRAVADERADAEADRASRRFSCRFPEACCSQ